MCTVHVFTGANKRRKIQKLINEEFDSENSENDENTEDDNEITEKSEFKEDIYGRKRDKDGNIVQVSYFQICYIELYTSSIAFYVSCQVFYIE